ncbi:sensor histidine kinase [Nonlabens ponticola]|uniref:histidine kinase n=1 Tax=Nonlabens ponticola TaxID=2496866 RepID=A0A3S9MW92_9FLAO|nr:HAMP domain-containing sensor histidine kinase [Nonlabens ponticola]AZQ43468.1 HAMP domain-containing histidine kinase [Nonlabens ponticola]
MLDKNKNVKPTLDDQAYFLKEVARATKTGVYSASFTDNTVYFDNIARDILEIPESVNFKVEECLSFFQNHEKALKLFKKCLKGKTVATDIKVVTYTGKVKWMRFTADAKFDHQDDIVGARGVFTSIDRYVRHSEQLEKHSQTIEAQNEHLVHFAHIVSHNLRSHSSNLELTLELFKENAQEERTNVFYSYLQEISDSLSATLKHLNQVVTINSQVRNMEVVSVQQIANKAIRKFAHHSLNKNIAISTDFHLLEFVEYVPDFLESIITTLITNSIAHRKTGQPLLIKIKTKVKKSKRLLIVKDNSRGLDDDDAVREVFNVHHDKDKLDDENNLGLFLMKNQVEALGGDIVVKSVPGNGTTFTIKL